MKPSFLLLAGCDLALLVLTAIMGLRVQGSAGFFQHFLLGVMAGLFTCFVHIVLFMYFVVQEKVMKQACLQDGLAVAFAVRTADHKSRALRAAVGGIVAILITSGLGAAVGQMVRPEVHLIAAFAAIGLNGALLAYEYVLIDSYAGLFREAFPGE